MWSGLGSGGLETDEWSVRDQQRFERYQEREKSHEEHQPKKRKKQQQTTAVEAEKGSKAARLDAAKKGQLAVGSAVSILWPEDNKRYAGIVESFDVSFIALGLLVGVNARIVQVDTGEHWIKYDDGDEQSEDLEDPVLECKVIISG